MVMAAISHPGPSFPSSTTEPVIDWGKLQEKASTKKVRVNNYAFVYEAFRKLDQSTKDKINLELKLSREFGGGYLFLEGVTPRPLFVTKTDVFIVFDRQKLKFGDRRIGKGASKNFYHAVNLTTGKVRGFLSMKGIASQNIKELRITQTTGCGPKIYGHNLKPSKSPSSKFFKVCAVVKLCNSDLENALNNGLIKVEEPQQRLDLFKKVADQVALVHKNGYIHRDLKFPNFLYNLKKNGGYNIVITDFGFSTPKNEDDRRARGSILYMAPQSRCFTLKPSSPSEKTDAWALGMNMLDWGVRNGFMDGFSQDSDLYNDFVSKFIEPSGTRTPDDLVNDLIKFMKELSEHSGEWITKPNESDAFEFAIWNLLRVNPELRWTPEEALRFLSSPHQAEAASASA